MPGSSPASASIRLATLEDLADLVELSWSIAAEGRWIGAEIPFDRDERRTALAKRVTGSDGVIFVADAGDHDRGAEIVGNITVDLTSYGVAGLGMMLAPPWRGRGLGTALLDAGLAWAVNAGAHKAALEVWPHNEAALALYRKAGFVEEGRKRRHYRRANGEIWDAILMGLPLPPV
jgi:RimJ/RimL family protein N-acetyltransferase